MSKEKVIKENVKATQRKLLIFFLAIIFVITIITINIYANNNDDYVVEIKDDGSYNLAEDDNSTITKTIVEDDAKSLTYEVKINNLNVTTVPEIAIVIDNSKSMSTNDSDNEMKGKAAIQFVTDLKSEVPKAKISLSSNSGVKVALSTSALATYTNAINAITYTDNDSVIKAIDYASGTFSGTNTDKYLIIFTDVTDSLKERIELATYNGVNVYTISTGIINNEYLVSNQMGDFKLLKDISDFSYIYNRINESLINVTLTDVFSEEVQNYFNFELISKDDDIKVEETTQGYILKCDDIKEGETKTLKYKLTLKDDTKIDAGKIYRDINSSDNISIEYEKYNNFEKETNNYETDNSPIIIICRKYSLTIKAVSEKSNDVPVQNLDVKVVGTTVVGQDLAGNDIVKTIFDKTLTTDSKGNILIDELKTLGDITFEIKPEVNQFGYTETDATTIIVHNDPTGVGTIWAEADITTPEVDVVNRNITVTLPISVQTYEMVIKTEDLNDSNVKLGGVEYRLIQPKLNSKYDMDALYGTTQSDGTLTLKPSVMTKDGSYQYILSQMNELGGYDDMGNVTLIVTFENGKVTKIAHQYNDQVSTELINSAKTEVTVGLASQKVDTFYIELNLKDDTTSTPLFGATYDFELTRTTSSGALVVSQLNGYMTDNNGQIRIEVPGTGYMNLKVTETSPKAGYVANTTTKEILIYRYGGEVQYAYPNGGLISGETVNGDSYNNKVEINLVSHTANEQNRIQVNLVDSSDLTVNIPNVLLGVNKVGETVVTQGYTDKNGIANFIIANDVQGSYQYEINLLTASPNGYLVASSQLAVITVTINNEGHLIATPSIASSTTSYSDIAYEQDIDNGYIYDTAVLKLGFDPDPTSNYMFKIKLLDGATMKSGLAGATYCITMYSDGEEVKYLSNRTTDENGEYSTRIVGGGSLIDIYIDEVDTVKKYKLTENTQHIELQLNSNGSYDLTSSAPYTYDVTSGSYRGAEQNETEIIYHDLNEAKTAQDTYVNLYVNKMDTNEFLVSGVKVRLSSDTLKDSEGNNLDVIRTITDSSTEKTTNQDYYVTDQNGYFEILGIKLSDITLNNGEREDYLYIEEVETDDSGNATAITNTDITLKITFRENEETGVIEVTNVEATWGNRLVKSRTFSSRETGIGYESSIYLDLYTDFDDVGNFSIDLKKIDKDGNKLVGSKYDIVVMRPDGTNLVRKGINVTDNVELEGILVSAGTKIEITESEAPIGYNINQYTEIITITNVDAITGIVSYQLEASNYLTPRAQITDAQAMTASDGSYKIQITLELTDYELDTFKMGITVNDSTTLKPVSNYTFTVDSSKGAHNVTSATGTNGKTTVQIGANYKIDNYVVTYTINTKTAAKYYKALTNPITVDVVFDLNGNVKAEETILANQEKTGFGTVWSIGTISSLNTNDIDLTINVDPYDPLVVNVQTQDALSGNIITTVNYRITPTINLAATGTTSIQVGYVLSNGTQTYTIEATNLGSNYEPLEKQQFSVVYDTNGDISTLVAPQALTNDISIVSYKGKQITIKIIIEPKVPITIKNTGYLDGANLANTTFEISVDSQKTTVTTDTKGETNTLLGKFGEDSSTIYTIKQTSVAYGYTKVNDFKIEVFYDSNRIIKDVQILGNVNDYAEFVTVSYTVPSTSKNTGYNGNANGIVNIEIKNYSMVPITIKNTGYFDGLNLANGTFEISVNSEKQTLITDINGEADTLIGEFVEDSSTIYTIKQTTVAFGYAKVDEFQIEVFYDSDRVISDVKILGDINANVEFVTASYTVPSTSEDRGYNGNENGIINIEVKNYPEVEFMISNLDRQNNTPLVGTTYKVESSINTKAENIQTNSAGLGTAYLDKSGYAQTVTYKITEVSSASRYQSLVIPAEIEVDFDNVGYILAVRTTVRSDVTTATIPTIYDTGADHFKIYVTILSNPELTINLTKVDEEDETIKLSNVSFEITARITKGNLANYTENQINLLKLNQATLTEEEYLSEVIERLKISTDDVETLKQDIAITKLVKELKSAGKITTSQEEEISAQSSYTQKVNKIVELGKATKTQINQRVNSVTYKEVVNELISNGTTSQDAVNDLLSVVKNLVRLDVDNVTTNNNGIAIAYMDKTLANKTIEYTIKETKKQSGYVWLDEVIIIEVTYDETGKMIDENPVKIVSGNIDINSVNQDKFAINVTIKNTESQDFKIHVTVEDAYDSDKKLEVANFTAYLTEVNSIGYSADNNYRVNLSTGSTTSGTGYTTAHGEDTESFGIYTDTKNLGRTLRIIPTQTPSSYYIGTTKYDSSYQALSYAILINLKFDDEGNIVSANHATPNGGNNTHLGTMADSRYVQVTYTKHMINVTIKYYPMLQVQMKATDMYTGASLSGKYTISTVKWGSDASSSYVSAGYENPNWTSPVNSVGYEYWGRTYSTSYTTSASITDIDGATRKAVVPTEADVSSLNRKPSTYERTLYIYENAEPSSPLQYQTYLPRYITTSYQYLVAKINVKYNANGEVIDVTVTQEVSHCNITSGFFTAVKATVNGHTIQLEIKYAPITTITATVIDEVSGTGLSGIQIDPYVTKTSVTNTSYENRSTLYYTTGNSGSTGWTYWGANIQNGLNRYELNTYTVGSGYEGYFDPGNIILDVTYDDKGRIASVTPKSTDQFGDVNAINISWSGNHINVTIKYCRKFNIELDKVNYYDTTKKLNAVFTIESSNGVSKSVASNTVVTIGKIYAGKKVKYTVSETTAPAGYLPVENLDIIVEFYSNGAIKSATSTSEYYSLVSTAAVDLKTNSLDKTDLKVNIKNKPRFDVSIELSDEFYPTLKLEGATFEITNSKGDVDSGGVVTDKNGLLETYIGPIYPNETVTYTVKQTNTVSGYYENTTIIEFNIHFNENGKIESYTLTNGTDIATINPTAYIAKQEIKLNVTNMPKNIKIGVYKYDSLTNNALDEVSFKVTAQETGKTKIESNVTTESDGYGVAVIDTFKESTNGRVVTYTISEIAPKETYRKIEDVVIEVTYKEDGSVYLYNVKSNPSGVGIEIATNKNIKYVDGTPVHMKLTIPNDNAYDLIVKNEDANYKGLGIEGTTYDVSISATSTNRVVNTTITTNSDGIAKVTNQNQSGTITISIAENNIGEGYRENIANNNTVIEIAKGTGVYSLELNSNSNETYAEVAVDDELGTITVTFKNETKLELTVLKEDINSEEALSGAEFAIESNELDSHGKVIEGTQTIITESSTSDLNGLMYFDLGVSHQSKTVQYTFTEITAPEGYDLIEPINVTVKFNQYGHIISMTDDSFRAEEMLATTTGKSHSMIVVIGNGYTNGAYTIKVVNEDSDSGIRINGAIFQVDVTETSTGATNKNIKGTTGNVTSSIAGNMIISESGALKVTGVTAEGTVNINISELYAQTGYTFGINTTAGKVIIETTYSTVVGTEEKSVDISLVDNGGLDVTVDNINKVIIIKVLNDSEVKFEVTKIDATTNEPMKDVEFTITSAIVKNGVANPTGFSETLKLTDDNGYTEVSGDTAYAGCTVLYTLTEAEISGYDAIDPIIFLVQYDANGNISTYNILSNKNDIEIKENATEDSTIYTVEKNVNGEYEVKTKTAKISTGTGSKILQLEVYNTQTVIPHDYQIQIGKYNADSNYPNLIPGARYEITVNQEYGKASTTWVDITDENGIITSPYFSGHGTIEVSITEIDAPEGYKLDNVTRTTRFIRYEDTQKMVLISTDSGATFNEDYSMVYLTAKDEQVSGVYNIIINKIDGNTGSLIADNPATIKLQMASTYDTITQTVDPETGDITETTETATVVTDIAEVETDENGLIVLDLLTTPTTAGDYTYILSETGVPKDYYGIAEDEVEIVVTFGENENQEMIIKNVVVKDATDVKAAKSSDQIMSIIVYNSKDDPEDIGVLGEDEFGFDIRKVDSDLVAITGSSAKLTLTDTLNVDSRDITIDQLGRTDLVKFKIPSEAGVYKYVLNEIEAPIGYEKYEGDMEVLVEFLEDADGKIYLNSVTTRSGNLVYANAPEEGELPSKKIRLKVINEDLPYSIVIEKHHELDPDYPYYIEGVTFDIVVKEEFAKTSDGIVENKVSTYRETTNSDGIITLENFTGYGRILVEITEVSAPAEYEANYETKHLEFYRAKADKSLNEYDSSVNYDLDEENQIITLKPVNEMKGGLYAIVINKIDKDSNVLITNNSAQFNLYMIRNYYNYVDVTDPITGEVTQELQTTQVKEPIFSGKNTDEKGMIVIDSAEMPTEEGKYTFELEEVSAPDGYSKIPEVAEFEVTFDYNEEGEMVITNIVVTKQNEYVKTLTFKDQLIALAVYDEQSVTEGMVQLDITKVDTEDNAILTDTAVFKLTDNSTSNISYMETSTDDAKASIEFEMPKTTGTYEYTINEIKAPNGYALNRNDILLKVTYDEDEEGMYISNVEVIGDNVNYIVPTSGIEKDRIRLNITNEEGEPTVNTKPYTLIINKIDSITNERILDRATFEISLVNGEIVHAATNTEGQIIIENVYMPANQGDYEIVIKELQAPEVYKLDTEMKIVNVSFTGTGDNMVISNEYLGTAYNRNIEIVYEECTEDTIVLNVLNDDGKVKLDITKVDEDGKEILTDTAMFKFTNNTTSEVSYLETDITNALLSIVLPTPEKEGTYEYTLNEVKAPTNYVLDESDIQIKLTYNKDANGIIYLEKAEVNGDNIIFNKTEDGTLPSSTLDIKVVNAKIDDLYVISREDENGEDIYDVMKSFTGKHYSIDTPFIDTRVAKAGTNMTVQEFIDNLESNGVMTILDSQGNQLSSTATVKTGMTLKATKGNKELTFTIVVKGDADGDGRVRAKDLDLLVKHLSEEVLLTDPIKLRALDMHLGGDGKIRATDLNEFYNVLSI
jgi:hypothetical protein